MPLLLLWLPLLYSPVVLAQWAPTRSFSGQDGLAQSQITAVVQDTRGYLWVGTQGGLSRYDGRRFLTYSTSHGLPDDVVTAIAAADNGSLLVGTDSGGIARWDGRALETIVHQLADHHVHVSDIHSLSATSALVATDEALLLLSFDRDDRRIDRLLETPVAAILQGWDGLPWVLAGSSRRPTATYRSAVCAPRLYRYRAPSQLEELDLQLGPDEVTASATLGACLWLARGDGSLSKLSATERLDLPGPADEEIQTLLPVAGGTVWIGSNRGLWRLDADGGLHRQILDPAIGGLPVSALHLDHEQSLWIGLWTQGLYQQTPSSITLFTTGSGLPSPTVWAFAEDRQGCVWMATDYGGVAIWCEDGWRSPITVADGLPSDRIMCLLNATDGSMWIGTDQGLSRRLADGSITTWSGDNGLPHSFVRGLAEDAQGAIWIATSNGLGCWRHGQWQVWRSELGLPDGLVRNLVVDHRGIVWLATHSGGLRRFDGERFAAITRADGLPNDRVWCLTVDSRGWLWVGTDYGIWVRRGGVLPDRIIDEEDGLPSKNVLFFVEDDDGFMWTGTNRGVTRIDPEHLQVKPVPAYESFIQIEANENASLLDSTGRLWLGLTERVVRFDPRHLPHNEVPPPIVLERLLADGSPVAEGLASSSPSELEPQLIELGPSVHELRFEYAALSYLSPAATRYRVMLEGYDPALSRPTDENHATYRNVPPGSYRFIITACNNDGAWAEKPVVLPLRLRPRWYQTLWFRIGAVLLAVVALVVWVRRLLAAEKRQQQRLETQVAQRTAELQEAGSRIKEQNRLLEELSRTDPLTGLANRRVLADQLPTEMAVLRRDLLRNPPADLASYHGITVLMIDLDGFKTINDRWGHDTGDEVLRLVAAKIRETLREVDLPVRWGGDELVVLGRGVDRPGTEQLVRRLLHGVATTRCSCPDGATPTLSASIGFLTYPLGVEGFLSGGQWHLLVEAADRLMYLAKQRGRARACGLVWRPDSTPSSGESDIIHTITSDPSASPPDLELVELEVESNATD